MRQFYLITCLAVFALVLCANRAFSQQPAVVQLFSNNEMQNQFRDDMQLSDEQAAKLGELGGKFRDEMQQLFRQNGPRMMLSEEARNEALDKIRAEGMKIGDRLKEDMRGVLSKQQYEKLEQRTFQLTGGTQGLLFSAGFGDTLKLSAEQIKKIEGLQRQMTNEIFQLIGKMQGASSEEQAEIRRQLEELVEKYSKLARDILTDEQKTLADKLEEETPDYIWSKIPKNRGKTREWRPGANSWQPGQGVPEGGNTNREAQPVRERGDRVFPGSE